MNKRLSRFLCLLLAMLTLCGCVSAPDAGKAEQNTISRYSSLDGHEISPVNFNEIEYIRPDLNILKAHILAVELELAGKGNIKTLIRHLDSCYEEYRNFYTMYTVADIRSCRAADDAFYAEELRWCEENLTLMDEMFDSLYRLCAQSDKGSLLEREYFWDGFVDEYSGKSTPLYNEEEKRLMRQESRLLNQYRQLIANPVIELEGVSIDLEEYLKDCSDEEYDAALAEYYLEYNPIIAGIYIELVNVRNQLARERGYESYPQMQYLYYFSRDYSAEDAGGYLSDIKEHMVPFYRQIMSQEPYSGLDYDYLSEDELHGIISSAADKMGGDIAEAYDFMRSYGYYDTAVDARKAPMSFQVYLDAYEAPFLFLDSYGDITDILSFSHEFGHYVDSYVNYNAYETVDVSECFSQAMELLMLNYFDAEQAQQLLRIKMLDMLEMYVQQASFAEFEQEVYSADPDELSPEYLNRLSLRLAKEYGYCSDYAEDYYAMSWIDIVHFFEMPFYVISYPVSNDIAMQIYELEQQQSGLGLEKYLEMLPRVHSGFIDTIESAGLESPFSPGRIARVVEDMSAQLKK